MISRLPRWAWFGAWVLAFIAGMINVVGLLGFKHQAVTHLTGTTTMLGAAIAGMKAAEAWHLGAIICAFVLGTVFSGFIIQDSALQLGRRYGAALLLETLLLCAAVPLLQAHSALGDYFASCACGLQNAMVSTFSGAVVRTTHLSGMFTDLGIALGHAVRGLPVDWRRSRLYALIISAFVTGGIAGGAVFPHLEYRTLLLPAALTGFTALCYSAYYLRRKTV